MNTDSHEREPVLGPFSATSIVVGAIIGIGIFFTPKSVALVTGSSSLAMTTWAIGGFIAMMGALTFAELGSIYTKNGGQYRILRDAYNAPTGFAYVFCNATIIQAGAIAIIGYYAALNFGVFLRGDSLSNVANFAMASGMIIGLTLANIGGVRWGSGIQNFTVVARVFTLLAITWIALRAPLATTVPLNADATSALAKIENVHPLALIFAGLVPVFFSFGGWQHALWIGGEVKNPRRNIPLAIVTGIAIVTVVYLLANWAYFRLLGFNGVVNSNAIAAEAVGVVWPNLGMRALAGAIAISAFGVLNAQLLSGPRLISGMARDGKFFASFAKVSATTGTPVAAIYMLGALGLAILLIAGNADRIDTLLNGVVLVDSVFFLLTGLALFVLRAKRKKQASENQAKTGPVIPAPSFRVPLYPFIPALFILGEMLVLAGAFLSPKYRNGAWIGLIWIVAAVLCYIMFFRGPTRHKKDEEPKRP